MSESVKCSAVHFRKLIFLDMHYHLYRRRHDDATWMLHCETYHYGNDSGAQEHNVLRLDQTELETH